MHWARRTGVHPLEFLANLVQYVSSNWEQNPIHPTHRDEREKQIAALRRRMQKAKTPRKKQQLRDAIRALK